MYCFTYANDLRCILNELYLWSDISSEHPIFIKTVSELTKKNLPEDIIGSLMKINKMFNDLNKKVEETRKELFNIPYSPYMVALQTKLLIQTKQLINEFLVYDAEVLKLLPILKTYGKEDEVWQTLLEHITHEQKFMYELFDNLKTQI